MLLSAVILLVVGGCAEGILRARGAKPVDLFQHGLTSTVPDNWTGWAMRPNVRSPEVSLTNGLGLHEDREIPLEKAKGTKRIAVVGSSVVWGLGESLVNTIPRAAQSELQAQGCSAEVLNFGLHGSNIVNASALVQTKLHQFQPDAIVIVMDLQMAFPTWPSPAPLDDRQATSVRQLGFFEALLKKSAQYSVVLSWLDDSIVIRSVIASYVPFPIDPPAHKAKSVEKIASPSAVEDVAKPAAQPPQETSTAANAYEAMRRRELGALVETISVFGKKMGIKIYFTTPYGPYFSFTAEQLEKFSLGMLATAKRVHGGLEKALPMEAELITEAIRAAAKSGGAQTIEMPKTLRLQSIDENKDFSTDGIHFTGQGYRHVGKIVAERMIADGLCK